MPAAPEAAPPPPSTGSNSPRATLALGLAAALLGYLAHPPAGWGLLAWAAPAPWLYLARLPQLPGRRPYGAIWLSGLVYWLLSIQWIRLPHPANVFGLLLLAAYLAVYVVAFVALTRVGVHRGRLPLWLAGPIVWTGLEWLRARLLTGFLMASLAHTQVGYPRVIQIADLFGEYGVTFLIVLVAASLAETAYRLRRAVPSASWRRFAPLAPAVLALAATFMYAERRWGELTAAAPTERKNATVALIQSNMNADWKGTEERDNAVMRELFDLSRQAVADARRPVDLVVWPETMYRDPLLTLDPQQGPPASLFPAEQLEATARKLAAMARELDAALLVGIERLSAVATPPSDDAPFGVRVEPYNSSVCVDRSGSVVGAYDKMHLLPFGEYIPLVRWFRFLRDYSPIAGGSVEGAGPAAFNVDGVVYSPNICYETVLPHLIRRHVKELTDRGQRPDVLVNLTNDAWYWGSSELDMHLASGVFRAVEMRTPLVVAANRGLSAYVDHLGRVVQATERNQPAYLVADVRLPPRRGDYPSLFAAYGDWFALACLVCCGILAASASLGRRHAASSQVVPQ